MQLTTVFLTEALVYLKQGETRTVVPKHSAILISLEDSVAVIECGDDEQDIVPIESWQYTWLM